jgi:hypothetical protein
MADYRVAGVWDHNGNPLDPARLQLSPKLRARLARWCDRFQQSFEVEIDLDAFAAEGRAIASAVEGRAAGLVDRLLRRGCRGACGLPGRARQLRDGDPVNDQIPAIVRASALATAVDTHHLVPALIIQDGDSAAGATSTSSPRTSATRTHRAYARACSQFFAWCEERSLTLATMVAK